MKKIFLKGTSAVALSLLLVSAAAAEKKEETTQAASKFAVYYVDMQKVINESAKGKQAKSLLESKLSKAKEKIKAMQEEIEKLKKELSSPALSKEAKEKKETQLQQKIRELQRYQQDVQIEVANLEKKYTFEIINEVVKLIQEYRKQNNIPMIIELRESGIIAADPKYDLTDKIIKLYDQQAGK